jgi:hypothetical protein
MDAAQFGKLSSKDRIAYIQSVTGKTPQQIVTQYGSNLNAKVGTKGWNDLQLKITQTAPSLFQGGGTSTPYKTEGDKAREAAAASEADYAAKARELLKGLPGYETTLKGPEWEQYYGEAMGTGPLAAYEAMRKQEEARKLAEEGRLGMALQDELQNVDVNQSNQLANAYSNLAMTGGLRGGARERIGAGSLEQAMAQRQGGRLQNQRNLFDLSAKTNENMLGFGVQEAAQRDKMKMDVMAQKKAEEERRMKMEQEQAAKRAEFEANQLKANQVNTIANTVGGA